MAVGSENPILMLGRFGPAATPDVGHHRRADARARRNGSSACRGFVTRVSRARNAFGERAIF